MPQALAIEHLSQELILRWACGPVTAVSDSLATSSSDYARMVAHSELECGIETFMGSVKS